MAAEARPLGLRAWDSLWTAAVRVPSIGSNLIGCAFIAEVARRGINDTLGYVGFTESKFAKIVYDVVPELGKRVLNLTTPFNYKELAICAAAFCALGIVGQELTSYTLGEPSPLYNQLGTWAGTVRIAPVPAEVIAVAKENDKYVQLPATEQEKAVKDLAGKIQAKPYHHPLIQLCIRGFNWAFGKK